MADPRIDGLTFTGSYEVGMELYRQAAGAYPRPVICEMGGKNPVIVSRQADLDVAAEGTARSAFGLSGQKCSAASRVYVERPVAEAFVERLVERARAIQPADPRDRDTYLGPVVDEAALERFQRAVHEARAEGEVLAGGHRVVRRRARAGLLRRAHRRAGPADELGRDLRAVRAAHRRRRRRLGRRGHHPGQRHARSA